MLTLKKTSDLGGMFFIIKGQHTPSLGISAYDPSLPGTHEWYQTLDCVVFNCVACGSSFENAVGGVESAILHYRTRENYFKQLAIQSTEDYYDIHYLGKRPKTSEELNNLIGKDGRRARTSPVMKELYAEIYRRYGGYYSDVIKEAEQKAFNSNVFKSPLERSRGKKWRIYV